MKIVIDNKIPMIAGVFEPYAHVLYRSGSAITAQDMSDADALITRTRTKCNADLLTAAARLKIIATATIGFDHIDMAYCAAHGIPVATSSGCNARAVAQWVFASLVAMGVTRHGTLGVVGVGNVGRVVADLAHSLGYRVLRCDPARAMREGDDGFSSLEQLLAQSDIVTIHVPLNATTRAMANDAFFSSAKDGAIFLNSSRGEVVDEKALIAALNSGRIARAAIDVWQNEPSINLDLLGLSSIGTPHIAGYSLQGKAMGTAMAVRSVAQALALPIARDWYPQNEVTPVVPRTDITWDELTRSLAEGYHIFDDDAAMRDAPSRFESMREEYRFREEFF